MPDPSVFISHSAKEPEAREARVAIADRLEQERFEVLLDAELEGGAPWRSRLRRYMDVCRGAVVLFSRSALTSPHVLSEVAILMQRRHRSASFPIVPVIVGDVRRADLRDPPWNATAITELQIVPWDPAADAVSTVVEPLRSLLETRDTDVATRLLEVHLAERIAGLRPETIRMAGDCLGLGIAEWEIETDAAGTLVQRLLESPHADQISVALVLAHVDTDLAETVYRLVAPHGLVPAAAGGRIRTTALAPECERGVGMNCVWPDTCELFVRRANFKWKMKQVPRAWSDAVESDVLQDILDVVARALGYLDEELPVDPGDINDALADQPVFLLLPQPLPGARVVEELRRVLGNLVLLVRCRTRDELERQRLTGVEYLLPELSEGEEERLRQAQQTTRRRLRALAG